MTAFNLTARERDTLAFLVSHHAEHGTAPSFAEIATGLGLSSVSGVSRLLDALEERGHIRKLPRKERSIVLLPRAYIALMPEPLRLRLFEYCKATGKSPASVIVGAVSDVLGREAILTSDAS